VEILRRPCRASRTIRRVRAAPLFLLGACGFSVPGQGASIDDAPRPIDSPPGTIGDSGTSIDAAIDAPGCPAQFVTVPGTNNTHLYAVFARTSQVVALSTCSANGTHLLRLDTQAEATALEAFIDAQVTTGNDTHLYRVIGSRNRFFIPNTWHDTDVSFLTFLPWGLNEPTGGVGEDCMVLKKESGVGVIGADQCGTDHEFACECD
jgi:hypothetical protein